MPSNQKMCISFGSVSQYGSMKNMFLTIFRCRQKYEIYFHLNRYLLKISLSLYDMRNDCVFRKFNSNLKVTNLSVSVYRQCSFDPKTM